MPKKPVSYEMDRILGRCEVCGKVKNPHVLDIFKEGKKNTIAKLIPTVALERGICRRIESVMLCEMCLYEYNFTDLAEVGKTVVVKVNKLDDSAYGSRIVNIKVVEG